MPSTNNATDTPKKGLRNSGTAAVGAFNETESDELASQELTLRGLSMANKAVDHHGLHGKTKTHQASKNVSLSTPGACAVVAPTIYHGLRRSSVREKTENCHEATSSHPPMSVIEEAFLKSPAVYHGLQRHPPMSVIEEAFLKSPAVYHGLQRSSVNDKKAIAEVSAPIFNEATSSRAVDPPMTEEPTDTLEPDAEQILENQQPQLEELSPDAMVQADNWDQEQALFLDQERAPTPVPHMDSPQTSTDNVSADIEANMPVSPAVNDESLVQARPVLEEDDIHREDLMEAAPFDVAADEQHKAEKRHTRQLQQMTIGLGMALLLVLIVLGVVIGVVLYGSAEPEIITLPPTPMQNETIALNATASPTTMAPTSPLKDFRATLPKFTLDNLNDTASPQSLAYDWLLQHPQVSNMTESRKLQLFVLGTLYHSIGGPYWRDNLNKDWMDYDKHECDWYTSWFGFNDDLAYCSSLGGYACDSYTYEINVCDNDQLEINFLVLASIQPDTLTNDTQIEIPPEIGLLSTLQGLWLIDMNIEGTVPTEVGLLDSLYSLQLSKNTLKGGIPTELQTTKVSWLELSNNQLSGSIPSELALFSDLNQLVLSNNALSGTLPSGLESLPNLTWITVNGNQLSGQIPTAFGKNLTTLHLFENVMSGSIPTEIGLATTLTTLALYSNTFTGSLPTELTLLSKLEMLGVTFNSFQGSLPDNLGAMTSLIWLSTWSNFFTGKIPTSIGLLENLQEAYLSDTQYSGQVPSEIGRLTNLERLWLDGNSLSGTLPTEMGLLESCMTLALFGNSITGSLPSELGALPNVLEMFLHETLISGQLPSELGLLTTLDWLSFHDAQLSGTLPTTLGQLVNASGISLYGNLIAGQIPSELGSLPRLYLLDLEWNQLTGTVPSELGNIDSLYRLYLSNNLLSGPLPNLAGFDGELEVVWLGTNLFNGSIGSLFTPIDADGMQGIIALKLDNLPLLTGTVPPELHNVVTDHKLGILDLDGSTALSGTIPSVLCNLNDDPNCSIQDAQGNTADCRMSFDCTDILCGCDCVCNTNSTK